MFVKEDFKGGGIFIISGPHHWPEHKMIHCLTSQAHWNNQPAQNKIAQAKETGRSLIKLSLRKISRLDSY